MANIMINKVCNLKCPYCFANEFVNNPNSELNLYNKGNMTIENFKKAVDFVLTDKNERIGIIGGEPTLHPKFREMLEILINDDRIKNVVIFTNGIYLEKYYKILTHNKFGMLVNCNSPKDIGLKQYNKLVKNLDVLHFEYYMGDKITLGINMYNENFEYDYIIELLLRYNKKHVRTSIVVPNLEEKRNKNPIEYFKRMKPRVFEFFKELELKGIMPTYDCNLMPSCIMTPEEKKWLKEFWKLESKCKKYCNLIDDSKCGVVIDILPDLTAIRCFGMSEQHKVPIYKFPNIMELRAYFANYFDSFAYTVFSSYECETCELRQNQRCMGGCLAFKVDKINKVREYALSLQ